MTRAAAQVRLGNTFGVLSIAAQITFWVLLKFPTSQRLATEVERHGLYLFFILSTAGALLGVVAASLGSRKWILATLVNILMIVVVVAAG